LQVNYPLLNPSTYSLLLVLFFLRLRSFLNPFSDQFPTVYHISTNISIIKFQNLGLLKEKQNCVDNTRVWMPDYECITFAHTTQRYCACRLWRNKWIVEKNSGKLRCLKYNVDSELAYSIHTAENNTFCCCLIYL